MIRWLWELLWPPRCEHNWEYVGGIDRLRGGDDDLIAIEHTWRCTKCCKAKRISL
jgi:hypothetical protein